MNEEHPGLTTTDDKPVEVYTTLDLHLQRWRRTRCGPA
jgi:hypothetical protein